MTDTKGSPAMREAHTSTALKMSDDERRKRLLAAIGKHAKNERAKKRTTRTSK